MVGHAGFQAADIPDLRFRHVKYACQQLHRLVVGAGLIAGVELPQLFQIFKFVDLILGLAVDLHVQLVQVLHQHMLPVELLRPRCVVGPH